MTSDAVPAGQVPGPVDFRTVDPILTVWPAGGVLFRVFDLDHAVTDFNAGARTEPLGRFHFFDDPEGRRVPVLYAAEGEDAAIAETVFHDVAVGRGTGFVPARRLAPLALGRIRPLRDLRHVELFGYGLRRLGLRPGNLTDTDADTYPRTVAWAAAIHAARPDAHGLVWMSRQFNAEKALILFGDRLGSSDLDGVPPAFPLIAGRGRRSVERAANRAGIVIG